jgi:hypothetical protein
MPLLVVSLVLFPLLFHTFARAAVWDLSGSRPAPSADGPLAVAVVPGELNASKDGNAKQGKAKVRAALSITGIFKTHDHSGFVPSCPFCLPCCSQPSDEEADGLL